MHLSFNMTKMFTSLLLWEFQNQTEGKQDRNVSYDIRDKDTFIILTHNNRTMRTEEW